MTSSAPRFFLPNRLSFLRILLGIAIPFLILQTKGPGQIAGDGAYWTALGLFIFGAFTDFWDGWIARRHRLETAFGRILDPTADKIFILGTMTSLALRGIYSYWYLVPIFLREIAVTFSRIVWLQKGHAVGAERAGKLKLCLQVVSIFCSFLYLAAPSAPTALLNQGVIILVVLMTLYSGFYFFLHNQKLATDPEFLRAVAGVGVGQLKPFPGTYGSLLGLAVYLIVGRDLLLHLVCLTTFLALAYFSIPRIGLGDHEDPLEIVVDEVAGVLVAFLGIPINWASLLLGFVLFRMFDVTKLPPLNWLEKRRGVHGIMLDDLGAGVYTWLILKFLFR